MDQNQPRIEQFKQEVADMHIGVPSAGNERTLLVVGVVLMVVGIALILGGWWGASGEGTVVEQFPYLISGGVLGLASIIVGSVLFARYSTTRFLRYWIVRLVYEQQAQGDRIIEALGGQAGTTSSAHPEQDEPH